MYSFAVVKVQGALDVSGSFQVDTGGNLLITSDSFTAAGGVNMQGGTVHGIFGLDLDEILITDRDFNPRWRKH